MPVLQLGKTEDGRQENARSAALGSNLKVMRALVRPELGGGYYICLAIKKSIRTLHIFGSCVRLPGVDDLKITYHGRGMPKSSACDERYQLCASEGVNDHRPHLKMKFDRLSCSSGVEKELPPSGLGKVCHGHCAIRARRT